MLEPCQLVAFIQTGLGRHAIITRAFGVTLSSDSLTVKEIRMYKSISVNPKRCRLAAAAFEAPRIQAYAEVKAACSERICPSWSTGQRMDVRSGSHLTRINPSPNAIPGPRCGQNTQWRWSSRTAVCLQPKAARCPFAAMNLENSGESS